MFNITKIKYPLPKKGSGNFVQWTSLRSQTVILLQTPTCVLSETPFLSPAHPTATKHIDKCKIVKELRLFFK